MSGRQRVTQRVTPRGRRVLLLARTRQVLQHGARLEQRPRLPERLGLYPQAFRI